MIGLLLGGLVLLLVIGGSLFLYISPQFGGTPTAQQKATYQKIAHYSDGQFRNLKGVEQNMSFSKGLDVMWQFIKGVPNREPEDSLPVEKLNPTDIQKDAPNRITWFGHSTFLLELDGKTILIDPMLGDSPSPLPWLGSKRFSENLPIAIDDLPAIDAIILSHDHYDHLDYGSIRKLKDKTEAIYTPLAVGVHLREWGVDTNKIHELNWWDSTAIDSIKLIAAPAQHFSGRGLFDRNATQWASWIIQGPSANIYFSGDGGYGDHFQKIGEQYGPFDLALMECGQYNERWSNIHLMPEESVMAAQDVQAQWMMPIHWGAFSLALHTWKDPAERVTAKAHELGMPITTPKIGEPIVLEEEVYPVEEWWRGLE